MVRTDLDISIRINEPDSESSSDDDHREAQGDLESQGYDPWANFTDGSAQPLRPKKGREPQNDRAGVGFMNGSNPRKGRQPRNDGAGISIPLVSTHGAVWDTDDAPPPAFLESQQGSSSILISAGPSLRQNEKSSQHGGMAKLSPPVTE
jgi:hypothetical protein